MRRYHYYHFRHHHHQRFVHRISALGIIPVRSINLAYFGNLNYRPTQHIHRIIPPKQRPKKSIVTPPLDNP